MDARSLEPTQGAATTLTPLTPTGPPMRPVRRSRWRVAFAVILAVVPLLCVAGIPFAFHSYDTATKPDRSAPDVAVHNYLQAFLVYRDDAAASEFACADQSGLAAFKAFRADLLAREKRFDVGITVGWGALNVTSEASDAASVTTELTISQSDATNLGNQGEQRERWDFRVDRSSEWRVCGATETG